MNLDEAAKLALIGFIALAFLTIILRHDDDA